MNIRLGFLVFLVARTASGQSSATVPLKPATGTLAAEFNTITSVRELSDGRILVSDPRDKRIVVGDFRDGSVKQIGRIGHGPKEYAMAFPLQALGGDSSLMADGLNGRWLLFNGTEILGTVPADNPAMRRVSSGFVYGIDSRGNLLTNQSPPLSRNGNHLLASDSDYAVLVSRTTGRVDTVAHLWPGPLPSPTQKGYSSGLYASYEQAVLAGDGWVAIVRSNPSRVDWRLPDGKVIRGAALSFPVVPTTMREKLAYMARRAGGDTPKSPDTIDNWPATIPAWSGSGWPLRTTPDGKLVKRRNETADHPEPRYDVVNRRGELERTISLAPGGYILGFGKGTVYVAATDADDIVRLERHPWP